MPRHLGKDPVLAQHLRHDHLRKEHLVDFVQKLPRHFKFQFPRLMEFDSDHEPSAAHFFYE